MLEQLLKLLDSPRDSALLRFGIANEYARTGDWVKVATFARDALERQRDFSAAWKLLGKAQAECGEQQAALETYQAGIAIANSKGDVQAAKEMTVFARRIEKALAASEAP